MKKICRRVLRLTSLVMLRTHRLSLRYPRTVVALTGLVTLVMLVGTPRLQMLLSVDDMIDGDFATYGDLKSLNESFNDNGSLYALFTPENGGQLSKEQLCAVRSWVQNTGDTSKEVGRIMTSFGPSAVRSSASELRFEPILDPDCGATAPETAPIAASMDRLARSPWGVTLASRKHNDVVANLLVKLPEESGRYGSINTQAVEDIMRSFEREVQPAHPGLKTLWTGVAYFQVGLKKGYELTGAVSIVMFLFVIFLLRLIFGTWRSGFLFGISYVTTLVWTYGGMGFAGAPIDVLSNSLGLLVLVATIEDFLFVAFVAQRFPGKSWRRHFRELLVPSFFTSVTTAVGFDALNAGELDIIRRFGSWSSFAAMVEWFLVFMFLPSLLALFPKLRNFTVPKPPRWVLALESVRLWSIPRYVALGSLALYAVGLAGAGSLIVQDSPHKIFSEDHPFRKAMSYIKESRGWITELSLVFDDPEDDAFNSQVIEKVRSFPKVRDIESPVAVKEFLGQGLPEHRAVLAQSLYAQSPFSRRLANERGTTVRAIVFLEDTDVVHVNSLHAMAKEACQGRCHLAGTLVSYGEFSDRVLTSFLDSMVLSIVLVLLLLLFLLLALDQGNTLRILVSSIWGPMILLSLFVIFRFPISYITSVFVSLLVGMAGDNAIHYLFANSRQHADNAYKGLGGASILMTLCMIAAVMVLFVSIFAPMKTLGALLIAGFILTLLGDFWILQALEKVRFFTASSTGPGSPSQSTG